jgi:hypothetical protein
VVNVMVGFTVHEVLKFDCEPKSKSPVPSVDIHAVPLIVPAHDAVDRAKNAPATNVACKLKRFIFLFFLLAKLLSR